MHALLFKKSRNTCKYPSFLHKAVAGFKRLWFPVTANHSAAGIPLADINNFIQIWCGVPFYGTPCRSDSRRMYLEPHGLPFKSSSRKYIWIILLRSNTNDSLRGFHRADCKLQQCPAPACHMIWIYIHSVPDGGLRRAIMGNCSRLKPAYVYWVGPQFNKSAALPFYIYVFEL